MKSFLFCLFFLLAVSLIDARPLSSCDDYLVIMVHGVSGDPSAHPSCIWDEDEELGVDMSGDFVKSLLQFGFKDENIYYYNFSDPNNHFFDDDLSLANEFGDRALWKKQNGIAYAKKLSKGIKDNGITKRYRSDPTKVEGSSDLNNDADARRGSVPPLNDLCWIEQSIKNWEYKYCQSNYAAKMADYPAIVKDIPLEAYPRKIIVIAHSMGGLTTRSYLFSPQYRGELDKVLTIDSPHLGSDVTTILANNAWTSDPAQFIPRCLVQVAEDVVTTYAMEKFQSWLLPKIGIPDISTPSPLTEKIVAAAGATAWSTLFSHLINLSMGYKGDETAIMDMLPTSTRIANLRDKQKADLNDQTYDLPMFRIVYSDGVPSPSSITAAYKGSDQYIQQAVNNFVNAGDQALRYGVQRISGVDLPLLKFATNPDYWLNKSTFDRGFINAINGGFDMGDLREFNKTVGGNIFDHYPSTYYDAPVNLDFFDLGDFSGDGDLFVPVKSQKAESVKAFQQGNTKRYHVDFNRFEDDEHYQAGTLSMLNSTLNIYTYAFYGLDIIKFFAIDEATKTTIDAAKIGLGLQEAFLLIGIGSEEILNTKDNQSTILKYLGAHGTSVGAVQDPRFTALADITKATGKTILEDALYEKPFVATDSVILYGAEASKAITVKDLSFNTSSVLTIRYVKENPVNSAEPDPSDYLSEDIQLSPLAIGLGSVDAFAEKLSKTINTLNLASGNIFAASKGPIVFVYDSRINDKLEIALTSANNLLTSYNESSLMRISRSVIDVRVDDKDFDRAETDGPKVFDLSSRQLIPTFEDIEGIWDGIQINQDILINHSEFDATSLNNVAANLSAAINSRKIPFIHSEVVSGNIVRVYDDSYNTLNIREINTHTYNFTIKLSPEFIHHQPNQNVKVDNELGREEADSYVGVPYRVRDLNTGDIHYYKTPYTATTPPLKLIFTVDDLNPAKLTSFGLDLNYGSFIKFKFDAPNNVALVDEISQDNDGDGVTNNVVKSISWDNKSRFTVTFDHPLVVFKEGRNLIRIRTKNPAGQSNLQLMYFDVFSTPPIASDFSPLYNAYINQNKPDFKFRVNFIYGGDEKVITDCNNIDFIKMNVTAEKVTNPCYQIVLGGATNTYPVDYAFTIANQSGSHIFKLFTKGGVATSTGNTTYWTLYNDQGGFYYMLTPDGKSVVTEGTYSPEFTANRLAEIISETKGLTENTVKANVNVIQVYPKDDLLTLTQTSTVTNGIGLIGRPALILSKVSIGNIESDDKLIINPEGTKEEVSLAGITTLSDIKDLLVPKYPTAQGYSVTIENSDQDIVIRSLTAQAPDIKLVDNFIDNLSIISGSEDIKLFEPNKGFNANAAIKKNTRVSGLVSSATFDADDQFEIKYQTTGNTLISKTYTGSDFTGSSTEDVANAFRDKIRIDFPRLDVFSDKSAFSITPKDDASNVQEFSFDQNDYHGWKIDFTAFPLDPYDEIKVNGQPFMVGTMASAQDFADAINTSTNRSLNGLLHATVSGGSSVIVKDLADGQFVALDIFDKHLAYEISIPAGSSFVTGDELQISEGNSFDEGSFYSIDLSELVNTSDADKLQDLYNKITAPSFRINLDHAEISGNKIIYVARNNENVFFQTIGATAILNLSRIEPNVNITSTELHDNITLIKTQSEFTVLYTPPDNQALTTNGLYAVSAQVKAGDGTLAQANWQFTYDTKPPFLAHVRLPKIISSYSNDARNMAVSYYQGDNTSPTISNISLSLTGKNTSNLKEELDGEMVTGNSWKYFSFVNAFEDIYQLSFSAMDLAQNTLTNGITGDAVVVDNTAPVLSAITLTNPIITSNSDKFLKIEVDASDNFRNIDASLHDYPDSMALTYEFYRLNADNTLGIKSREIGVSYGSSTTAETKTYEMDFGNGAHMLLADGRYKCQIIAEDLAGNKSTPVKSDIITVDMTPPHIFDFITTRFITRTGDDVKFDFKVSEQFDDEGIRTTTPIFLNPQLKITKPDGSIITLTSGFVKSAPVLDDPVVKVPYCEYTWTLNKADAGLEGEYNAKVSISDNYTANPNIAMAQTFFNIGSIKPKIAFPSNGAEYTPSQSIVIKGVATDPTKALPDFQKYTLSYKKVGASDFSTDKLTAYQSSNNVSKIPVPEGVLGYWNLSSLESSTDGVDYILRLTTSDGLVEAYDEVTIKIKNTIPESQDFVFTGPILSQGANSVDNVEQPAVFTDAADPLTIGYHLTDDNTSKVDNAYKVRAEVYNQNGLLLFNHVEDKVYASGLEGEPVLSSATANDSGFYVWISKETINGQDFTVWNVKIVGGQDPVAKYTVAALSEDVIRLPYADAAQNYFSPTTTDAPKIDPENTSVFSKHSVVYSTTPGSETENHSWLKIIPLGSAMSFAFSRQDSKGLQTFTSNTAEQAIVFSGATKTTTHGLFGPVLTAGAPGYIKWDGLSTASRTLVNSGTYTLKLIAENPANGLIKQLNSDFQVVVKDVAISHYEVTPSFITTYDVARATIPNFSTVTLKFNINRDAYVDIDLQDITNSASTPLDLGHLVNNQLYAGKLEDYTYIWNGTYNGATRIQADHKYKLIVKARVQEYVDGNHTDYAEHMANDIKGEVTATTAITKNNDLLLQPGLSMESAEHTDKYSDAGSYDYFWKADDISGVYAPDYPYEAQVEFKGVQKVNKFPYERFSYGINRRRNKVNLIVVAAFHASGSEYWSRGCYCRSDGGKNYYGGVNSNVTFDISMGPFPDPSGSGSQLLDYKTVFDAARAIYDSRGFSIFTLNSGSIGVFPETAFPAGFDFNAFYRSFADDKAFPLDHDIATLEVYDFSGFGPKTFKPQELLWKGWEDKNGNSVYDPWLDKNSNGVYDPWVDKNNNGVWDAGEGDLGDDLHDDLGIPGVNGKSGDGILDPGEGDGLPTIIGDQHEPNIDKYAGAFVASVNVWSSDNMRMGSWPCPKRDAGVTTSISVGIKMPIWRAWADGGNGYGYNSFLNLFSTWDPANLFAYSTEGYINWDNFDNDLDGQLDGSAINSNMFQIAPEPEQEGDGIPEANGYVRWGNEPLKFDNAPVVSGTIPVVRGNIQRIDIKKLMDSRYLRTDGKSPDYGKLEFSSNIYNFIDGQEQLIISPFKGTPNKYPNCAYLLELDIYTKWQGMADSQKKVLRFLSNNNDALGTLTGITKVVDKANFINIILSSDFQDNETNNQWGIKPATLTNQIFTGIDSIVASVCIVGANKEQNRCKGTDGLVSIPWPISEKDVQAINLRKFVCSPTAEQSSQGLNSTISIPAQQGTSSTPGLANDENDFAIVFDGATPSSDLTEAVRLGFHNGSIYDGNHIYRNRIIKWDEKDRADYLLKTTKIEDYVPKYQDLVKFAEVGNGQSFVGKIIDDKANAEHEIKVGDNVTITNVYPKVDENLSAEIVEETYPTVASYVKFTRKGYGSPGDAKFSWSSNATDEGLNGLDDDFDGEIDDSQKDPADIVQDGSDNILNEDPKGLVSKPSPFVLGQSNKFLDVFKNSYLKATKLSILDPTFETNDALIIKVTSTAERGSSVVEERLDASAFPSTDNLLVLTNIKNAIEADSKLSDVTAILSSENTATPVLLLGSKTGSKIEITEAVTAKTNLSISVGTQGPSSVLRFTDQTHTNYKDNPAIGINTADLRGATYSLFYINGSPNKDLELLSTNINPVTSPATMAEDNFLVTVKPVFPGAPKRFVEIKGAVGSPYQLLYSKEDGSFGMINDRKSDDKAALAKVIGLSDGSNHEYTTLGFWDVTQLQGFYTVYLLQYNDDGTVKDYDSKDVFVGEEVTVGKTVIKDPYGRASLDLGTDVFKPGDILRIVPVSLEEAGLASTGITPIGPIVKALPSQKFGVRELTIIDNTFDANDGMQIVYEDAQKVEQTTQIMIADFVGTDEIKSIKNLQKKISDKNIPNLRLELDGATLKAYRSDAGKIKFIELVVTTKNFGLAGSSEFPTLEVRFNWSEISAGGWMSDVENLSLYHVGDNGVLDKIANAQRKYYKAASPQGGGTDVTADQFRGIASGSADEQRYSYVLLRGEPVSFSKFAVFNEKLLAGEIKFAPLFPYTDLAQIELKGTYIYIDALNDESNSITSTEFITVYQDDDSVFVDPRDPTPPVKLNVTITQPTDYTNYGQELVWSATGLVPISNGKNYFFAKYGLKPAKAGTGPEEIKSNIFKASIEKVIGAVDLDFNESTNLQHRIFSTSAATMPAFSFKAAQASRVVLEIANGDGTIVYTNTFCVDSKQVGAVQSLTWDGKKSNGEVAGAGDYLYHLYAVDYAGRTNEQFGLIYRGTLVNDNKSPQIMVYSPTPGERLQNLVNVTGTVNEQNGIQVIRVIAEYLVSGQTYNPHTITINSQNDFNVSVVLKELWDISSTQGKLRLTYYAEDLAGNNAQVAKEYNVDFATYYVNVTGGDDAANDGLTPEAAFKTIQHAINVLPENFDRDYSIYIAEGDYTSEGVIAINGIGSGKAYGLSIINASNNFSKRPILNRITCNSENVRMNGLRFKAVAANQTAVIFSKGNIKLDNCLFGDQGSTSYQTGMLCDATTQSYGVDNVSISNCIFNAIADRAIYYNSGNNLIFSAGWRVINNTAYQCKRFVAINAHDKDNRLFDSFFENNVVDAGTVSNASGYVLDLAVVPAEPDKMVKLAVDDNVLYNLVEDNTAGFDLKPSNMDANPLLQTAAFGTNYYMMPQAKSPCVDAGKPESELINDIYLLQRGHKIDIGAVEYNDVLAPILSSLLPTSNSNINTAVVQISGHVADNLADFVKVTARVSKKGEEGFTLWKEAKDITNDEDFVFANDLSNKLANNDEINVLVTSEDASGNISEQTINNLKFLNTPPVTTIYPAFGDFSDRISVSLTVKPVDATIYYAIGASASFKIYQTPFELKEDALVRYYSVDAVGNQEAGKQKEYKHNVPSVTEEAVYISKTGSDATGNGTQTNPYRTIQHAYNQLPGTVPSFKQYVLYVSPGIYDLATDKIQICRDLGLYRYNKIIVRALDENNKPIIAPTVNTSECLLALGKPNVQFEGIVFKNKTGNTGSFVSMSSGDALFSRCIFIDEVAASEQAVKIDNALSDLDEFKIENCYFEGPSGTTDYYGLKLISTNNIQHTGIVVTNNTFNKAGILSLEESSGGIGFNNNIIQNNVCINAPIYGLDHISGNSAMTVEKCLIFNALSGSTNGTWKINGSILTGDPLVVSYSISATTFLKLSSTSPLINQGLKNAYCPSKDIFNSLRDNNPDIGATEYIPSATYYVSVDGSNSNTGLTEASPLADVQTAFAKINSSEAKEFLSRNYEIVLIDGSQSHMHTALNTDVLSSKTHMGGTITIKSKAGIGLPYISGESHVGIGYVTISNIAFLNKVATIPFSLEINNPSGPISISNCSFSGVNAINLMVNDEIGNNEISIHDCKFIGLEQDAIVVVEDARMLKWFFLKVYNNLFADIKDKALNIYAYGSTPTSHLKELVYNNTFNVCHTGISRFIPGGDYRNNIINDCQVAFEFTTLNASLVTIKNNNICSGTGVVYNIAGIYSNSSGDLNIVASGNISNDPKFIYDLILDRNPTIQNTSTCIDAGDNDVLNAISFSTDMLGQQRKVNETIDIGAFEYQNLTDATPPNIQSVVLSYADVSNKIVSNNSDQYISARDVTLMGSASDAISSFCELSCSYTLNQNPSPYAIESKVVALPGGRFEFQIPLRTNIKSDCDIVTVRLTAKDQNGNESAAFTFRTIMDFIKPQTSFVSPSVSQNYTNPIDIRFHTNDADASVWYSMTGDPESAADAVEFPNGTTAIQLAGNSGTLVTTYYYRAKDKAGNWEENDPALGHVKSVTFTYVPPILDYYVSLYGSDQTGDGTKENPFREINRALAEVATDLGTTVMEFPAPVHIYLSDEPVGTHNQVNGIAVFKHFQTTGLLALNPTSSNHLVIKGLKPERVTISNQVTGGNNETVINKNYVDISNIVFNNFELPYPSNPEQPLQATTEFIVPQYVSSENSGMVQLTSGQHITVYNCSFRVPEIPNSDPTTHPTPFKRNYGLAILANNSDDIKIDYSTFDGNNGVYIKGNAKSVSFGTETYSGFNGVFINASTFVTTTWRAIYVDGLNSIAVQNSMFQSCGNQLYTPPYDDAANPDDVRLKYYDINGSGSSLPTNARGAIIVSSGVARQYYIINNTFENNFYDIYETYTGTENNSYSVIKNNIFNITNYAEDIDGAEVAISASTNGLGIYGSASSSLVLKNNCFYDASSTDPVYPVDGLIAATSLTANNNLTENPLLSNGYIYSLGSACVGAGDMVAGGYPQSDIFGVTTRDAVPDGKIDIGAFEFVRIDFSAPMLTLNKTLPAFTNSKTLDLSGKIEDQYSSNNCVQFILKKGGTEVWQKNVLVNFSPNQTSGSWRNTDVITTLPASVSDNDRISLDIYTKDYYNTVTGNGINEDVSRYVFKYDPTTPSSAASQAGSGSAATPYTSPSPIQVTFSDAATGSTEPEPLTIYYTVNGSSPTSSSTSISDVSGHPSIIFNTPGVLIHLKYFGVDAAGNIETTIHDAGYYQYVGAATSPLVFADPPGGSISSKSFLVTLGTTQPGWNIEYRISGNGSNYLSYVSPIMLTFPASGDRIVLEAIAHNSSGTYTTPQSITYVYKPLNVRDVYVANNGSPTTGAGLFDNPFQTIQNAVDYVYAQENTANQDNQFDNSWRILILPNAGVKSGTFDQFTISPSTVGPSQYNNLCIQPLDPSDAISIIGGPTIKVPYISLSNLRFPNTSKYGLFINLSTSNQTGVIALNGCSFDRQTLVVGNSSLTGQEVSFNQCSFSAHLALSGASMSLDRCFVSCAPSMEGYEFCSAANFNLFRATNCVFMAKDNAAPYAIRIVGTSVSGAEIYNNTFSNFNTAIYTESNVPIYIKNNIFYHAAGADAAIIKKE